MRSGLARVLLSFGFLAAAVSYNGWAAGRTVLDSRATGHAAHTLLANPVVRRDLGDKVAKQLKEQLAAARPNPRVVSAAAAAAVSDPHVIAAFTSAITAVHAALLGNGPRSVTIDARTLTKAVHDALARRDPALAAQLAQQKPLHVAIDLTSLPHLGHAKDTAHTVTEVAFAAAALLLAFSLKLAHDRRAVARLGRRTAYLAFGPLLLFFVLPHVLDGQHNDAVRIAGALASAYRGRVLPSAIALVAAGAVIAIGALFMKRTVADNRPSAPLATTRFASAEAIAPYANGTPGALPRLPQLEETLSA